MRDLEKILPAYPLTGEQKVFQFNNRSLLTP